MQTLSLSLSLLLVDIINSPSSQRRSCFSTVRSDQQVEAVGGLRGRLPRQLHALWLVAVGGVLAHLWQPR